MRKLALFMVSLACGLCLVGGVLLVILAVIYTNTIGPKYLLLIPAGVATEVLCYIFGKISNRMIGD